MPTEPDLEKVHELCRLRTTLEAFAAARLPANPHRSAALRNLQRRLEQLLRMAKQGEYEPFHKTDMLFHRDLVVSCGLGMLVKCWDTVMGEIDAWTLSIKRTHWPSLMSLYHEHYLLMNALHSDHTWLLEQAVHQHVEAGWYRLASATGKKNLEIDPVDKAASFMETHFSSHLETDWIAKNVSFVSPSHLARLFRKKHGFTPNEYLRQTRLNRAAELLSTQQNPVAKIAKECGYVNVSHFTRDFGKKFGETPKHYREKHSSIHGYSVSY